MYEQSMQLARGAFTYLNFAIRLLPPLHVSTPFACLFLKVEVVILESQDVGASAACL